MNLGFGRLKYEVRGGALFDRYTSIRQCYLLSEHFLLLITENYLELINLKGDTCIDDELLQILSSHDYMQSPIAKRLFYH